MFATLLLMIANSDNTLTSLEAKQGWKLLFDGKTTKGWSNFKSDTIGKGWQVKDGALTIVDPGKAGDIVTSEKYDWFELQLDFKVEKGQNSGIMFHVAETGEATWHSGPEIQIYDHPLEKGVEVTGFLYQLYTSSVDASKPAGEWNHMEIVVAPKLCWTKVNGTKYYEYELGSKDFWDRIAKSKFAEHPEFAKLNKGRIAIQGDHGHVAFKNIKIRTIKK